MDQMAVNLYKYHLMVFTYYLNRVPRFTVMYPGDKSV
jgi:hypothetical protein